MKVLCYEGIVEMRDWFVALRKSGDEKESKEVEHEIKIVRK
jgi:hypothetical protein